LACARIGKSDEIEVHGGARIEARGFLPNRASRQVQIAKWLESDHLFCVSLSSRVSAKCGFARIVAKLQLKKLLPPSEGGSISHCFICVILSKFGKFILRYWFVAWIWRFLRVLKARSNIPPSDESGAAEGSCPEWFMYNS
jgi:hypothetical protein